VYGEASGRPHGRTLGIAERGVATLKVVRKIQQHNGEGGKIIYVLKRRLFRSSEEEKIRRVRSGGKKNRPATDEY